MHRIRQTAEDQQCLTPEQVKVGLDSPNICATQTSAKLHHFLFAFIFIHFFLVLFSSSILSALSLPSSARGLSLRLPFVQILFSNIEDILELHKEVLSAVESNLQPEPHPQHALGHVLLQFVSIGRVHPKHTHTHLI